MFTKSGCQPCRMTKKHLEKLGVKYEEYDAQENADHLLEFGVREVPLVVVYAGDDTISWTGYRPDRLDQLLEGK